MIVFYENAMKNMNKKVYKEMKESYWIILIYKQFKLLIAIFLDMLIEFVKPSC